MAEFGKKRFSRGYQAAVGMGAREVLHKNSSELVAILDKHGIINSNLSVFELGAGPGRNLYYIYKELLKNEQGVKNVKFSANDLWEKDSFKYMEPEIKNIIKFYEMDTEDLVNNITIPDLDLVLVSDHFMHLQYEKADFIIKKLLSEWKPEYIMLREIKKEFEAPDHPRLYHDYDQFLSDYEKVEDLNSKQTDRYFIWLLKRKK